MAAKRVWTTSDDGKIEYVSLTSDRLQEAIEVIRKGAFSYGHVCTVTGVSELPECWADFDEIIIDTAKHGMSIAAIDKETGKMVGIVLNMIRHRNISTTKMDEKYMKKSTYPQVKEFFSIRIHLGNAVDAFALYGVDCLMHLGFLGVLPQYSNRGIGYMLCAVSIELAKSLNKGENVKVSLESNTTLSSEPRPQAVTAMFSGFKSQRIGRKLGFEILKTISYEDLYHDEKSYASIIGDETKEITIAGKQI